MTVDFIRRNLASNSITSTTVQHSTGSKISNKSHNQLEPIGISETSFPSILTYQLLLCSNTFKLKPAGSDLINDKILGPFVSFIPGGESWWSRSRWACKFHILWLDTADKTAFGSQLNGSESQLGPE